MTDAVQHSDRQVLGHLASVSLSRLSGHAANMQALARYALSTREYAYWESCRSSRRRLQFLGGRIAAKLAANLRRVSLDAPPVSLGSLSVRALATGHRVVVDPQFGLVPVSISHTDQVAVAVAAAGRHLPAIDIESEWTRVRATCDFFHASEIDRLTTPIEAKKRWMLKETAGKLFGIGLSIDSHGLRTVRIGQKGLGVSVPACSVSRLLLAANEKAAVAFLSLPRDATVQQEKIGHATAPLNKVGRQNCTVSAT